MQPPKETLEEEKIITAQRQFRSFRRRHLHLGIFRVEPVTAWAPLKIHPDYCRTDLHYRLETIIANIVSHQKIINGNQLYHYTSLENLTSIINTQFLYGNHSLKKQNITFTPNVFQSADILTGDKNVICLCPGQVDMAAFTSGYSIKDNACRLSLNINQKNISDNKAIHNQFFKLADFWAPWTFSFSIDKLSLHIKGGSSIMELHLSFDGALHFIRLDKEEMIYYGNIFSINRFCAVQLFNIIDKIPDETCKKKLYDHLNQLPNNELKKLIIVFTQNLTLFAEYNFNACLPISDIRITEVLMLGDKKLKLDFSQLDNEQYSNALKLLSSASYTELEQRHGIPVDENQTICKKQNDRSFDVFGRKMAFGNWGRENFSNLESALFEQDTYIETRVGLAPSNLSAVNHTPAPTNTAGTGPDIISTVNGCSSS